MARPGVELDRPAGVDGRRSGAADRPAVGRRRPLPSGRAVAGGFVMALAAVLAFGAWLVGRPGPGTPVAVAAAPLAAGTRLDAADLSTAIVRVHVHGRVPLGLLSPAALVGRTLAVPVAAGAAIAAADVVASGGSPPLRPVPVPVSATDLVDLVTGQRVDLLVTTSPAGAAGAPRTSILVRGAEVIAIDRPSAGLVGGTTGGAVVTVGVADLAEVEAVVAAEHAGTVDVVVGEPGDGTGAGAGA